ncbi:DUF1217 domain-containing protein [Methylobacterium nonmethylotrophicum]|uniref:DUF1217 domain-containing protein n=1 Tax=Methylobacterium nonmethylotrophicum TaxID=1141884 RepID=A0A4Z0NH10_9HYPH|nr:DUF1217 domain-containing protein [Methylobacterium nonmethylotrophicum]TGD95613.1 DUF1217 domain-containing protein [Methylobacterium nonmethylotrophicum]
MTSTLTSYVLLSRNLATSLQRKGAEAVVARETAYYQANIGKVKSVDDLMADQRLYAYAMKAFGLEDMTYAKAFMRKVLTEGTADSTAFANRLADDRYVAFAKAFDFSQAASATGTDPTLTAGGYALPGSAQLSLTGALAEATDFSGTNEARFVIASQVDATTTKTATIVLNKASLAGRVADLAKVTQAEIATAINAQIAASGAGGLMGKVEVSVTMQGRLSFETTGYTDLGLDGEAGGDGANADTVTLAGGKTRTLTVSNALLSDPGQTAVDIGNGTDVAPDVNVKAVVDAYLQQSLESDAGAEDTGVRLALYFARKAPTLNSGYDVLGDTALTQVVNTVLGLPATSGATTSEALAQRASFIGSKVDFASFQDPAKVEAFARRFAAIWDAQNNTASDPILALFSNDAA